MAVGAIPVVANAADVQTISSDVLASTYGNEVKYSVGKLVPGSYKFTAQVLSKVYGVNVKIAGVSNPDPITNGSANAQDVNIEFTLTQETDVELTLVSTDPGEAGAGFTVSGAKVILDYNNFDTIKETLENNADALAAIIGEYNYAAKQEDVDAANALKTKAEGVAETYDDYKKFKLYADKSTIQEEIDALAESAAAKEAAYQNEQAYNRVNAAVTVIKGKYNTAVAEIEQTLVGVAAYLLDGAKAELNTEINAKITEATQASYDSYQEGTAVKDETTNMGKIPTEVALNTIVNDYKNQATTNINAYNALHKKVTDLQATLDAVVPAEAIASLFPKTEAQAAIDAVNTKVEAAKNSAAQLTLNVNTEEATAQGKITELAGKVTTANAEFNANKATTEAIAVVQKAYNDAKTAVDAKVSKDEKYKAADYYAAYLKTQQDAIDKLTADAVKAYKVDGTGTAQTYNAGLAALTTPITTAISDYQTNAIAAVDKYDALQDAINGTDEQTGYQDSLDIARAEFKDLAIYEAEGYDYKTKFDLIQKRINDIKKAITAAQGKVGAEHWNAMIAIVDDAAILTDIADLLAEKQTKQDQYDQNFLGNGLTDLDTRIAAFNTNATKAKLGADYQFFVDAETAIAGKVADIKEQKGKITPGAEGSAAAIQALGVKTTEIQAEQTALEEAAAYIAAKVTANGAAQTTLAGNITTLLGKITTFKNTYKIGQDASTLGNRGKAAGSITTEVGKIEDALGKLNTANSDFDPTVVTPVEKIEAAVAGLTISNLDKGVYDVKYKIGDDTEQTLNDVLVVDGTLTIDAVIPEGKTASITKLTYHENSQVETSYNSTDTENPGFNTQYTALATQENALETAAPGIKTKVENNAKANTAATTALTNLGTFEVSTLKNLKDVSNADGNFDTSNSDGNNNNAKKVDPANWAVFRSGLDADKNYAAKKKAIDDKIAELTAAITAANAAETLPYPWADEITVVTEDDPATTDVNEASSTTYKISEIKAAINALKTEAGTESANYWGYRNTSKTYFNVNIDASKYVANADVATLALGSGTLDKEFGPAASDLAAIEKTVGAGAEPYYTGLINSYKAERRDIIIKMLASLNGRTAVADNNARVNELKALVTKVKAIKGNADANLKKYTEQHAAAEETQTLWNSTYTEIAATDHSTKVQDWLDELDAIQVTLTAATNAVEENYKVGESVAKDFAAIKASINDVKARQNASYSEFVTADNKAAHESFMGYEKDGKHVDGAIELATKAYQTAVEERAKYSSTNADIKAAVDAAAATLDAALYSCPTDIATLTQKENAAYVATVSPEVFSVDDYNTQATTIQQNITTALDTFKDAVKKAINDNVWSPKKTTYDSKVIAAKNAIDAYDAAAKKDAFKDVENLIAAGEKALNEWSLAGVEAAIDGLADIDNMLAADKDAAAVKDINKRIAAADSKYTTVKTYIEGKTIADDVNKVKATQLDNLEKAYDDKDDKTKTDVAYAKTLEKKFANRNEAAGILDGFLTTADNCKKAVDNAIADDVNNTKAYDDMAKAIKPVAEKLAEAKEAAAPYKYATSFATDEATLTTIQTTATESKANGNAVNEKASVLADLAKLSTAIEATLTTAFGAEKTGLSVDITELKNQYNAYVAANGLGENATAYKKDIDDLEAAVAAIAIEDLDKPTDGIQYDEILAATTKLVKLQKDIADKETELLAANASTANADVLADFNTQIGALETAASLEGNDGWVGEQIVNGKKISEAIAAIQAQIADVKAAIQAEDNISFYKDQYQAKLDAIKNTLTPVANEIATKQAQFTANADAFTTLSAAITTLQGKVDAAKAKVGAYEHNGDMYDFIDKIEVYNDKKELTGGLQKTINDADAALKTAKDNVSLTANSKLADFGLNVATAEENVQSYLDESAYYEIWYQCSDLNTKLTNAIDAKYKADKYSNALWKRLVTEKAAINGDLNKLKFDDTNSYSIWKITPSADYTSFTYDRDENQKWIPKACTSDADYATHMQTVATIAQKIQNLSDAVDNLSLLGDANEDKAVNVLDYQKVLNMILDPTAQPAGDSDLFQNVDINQNEVIEVGDLTAIVNYILTHDWNGYAAARGYGMSDSNESLSMTQDTKRIAVSLANVSDYTAFQMDLVLPDGMKIVGTSLSNRAGESHKLYSRNQMDGSIRLLASSVTGETFSGNEGAVLYIDVETTGEYMGGKAELLNILFADTNAQTRSFTIGGDATGIDTVGTFEALKQKVYDLGGRVKDGLKKGINIIRRADGSTQKVVK